MPPRTIMICKNCGGREAVSGMEMPRERVNPKAITIPARMTAANQFIRQDRLSRGVVMTHAITEMPSVNIGSQKSNPRTGSAGWKVNTAKALSPSKSGLRKRVRTSRPRIPAITMEIRIE